MGEYFRGWYFRCQSDTQTLAVIPSVHRTASGEFCTIQLITDTQSFHAQFPHSDFRKTGNRIHIAGNHFGKDGLGLNIQTADFQAVGSLHFGPFTPLQYDIMGPFRFVPFMQCRHSVFSMRHRVDGFIRVNGMPYEFSNGIGYAEGDRGHSFPKTYAWTQCAFPDGALMLSVADIPLGPLHFTGIIGFVLLRGKEYRIATYLGAKILKLENREIHIRQGRLLLKIAGADLPGHPLRAPVGGAMSRTIHEHPSCMVHCFFSEKGIPLLDAQIQNAAFEYEY